MKKVVWSGIVAALLMLAAPADAVSLNTRGQVAHGVGGAGAYVDDLTLSTAGAGGTSWVDDNTLIYQVCDGGTATGCRLETYDVRSGARATVDQFGANSIAAGGGVWAKWLGGRTNFGVFTSTGFACPDCGLIAVGPDGSFAYKPQYQSNGPFLVRERDGSEWKFSDVPAYDVQLLGGRRIIWTTSNTVFTMNLAKPLTITPRVWRPRVAFLGGEAWVAYWTDEKGLVAHPFTDNTRGYVVRSTPDAFSHDVIAIGPRTLRVAFATNEGETPGSVVVRDINVDAEARVDLTVTAPPPPPAPPTPPVVHPPAPEPQATQAPNRKSVIEQVKAAHPEINTCDEDSLDKGRAAIVDWAAQRLNKEAGRVQWGRKSRGRPNGDRADNPNTDGLTFLRSDGRFEIIDAFVGATCAPNWDNNGSFAPGENGFFAPPQLGPEPGKPVDPPNPPDDPKDPPKDPQPSNEEVIKKIEESTQRIEKAVKAASDAEIAKLDELKVSIIKASDELKKALVQILPLLLKGGGLGGLLGGIK